MEVEPSAVASLSFIRNIIEGSADLIFYLNKFTKVEYLYIP